MKNFLIKIYKEEEAIVSVNADTIEEACAKAENMMINGKVSFENKNLIIEEV